MKIKIFFCSTVIAFIFYSNSLTAQSDNNSLLNKVSEAKTPRAKFDALKKLGNYYKNTGHTDDYFKVCQQLLQISQTLHNDSLLVISYGNFANYFANKSDFSSALEYYLKALHLAEKINDVDRVCKFYNNVADQYNNLKNYQQALQYLRKAQGILLQASAFTPALPQYVYMNLCKTFLGLDKPDSALKYVQLTTQELVKNKDDMIFVNALYNYALIYEKTGDADLSETYYKKSIALADSIQDQYNLTEAALDYSILLLKQKRYEEGKKFALKSVAAAMASSNKLGIVNAANALSKIFAQLNNRDSAYYYLTVKNDYRDSVFNEEQYSKVQEMTFAEQQRDIEKKNLLYEEAKARKENIEYAAIGTGILLFIILFLVLTQSVIANERLIKFLGLILLLILFEFLVILLHPSLSKLTHGSPVLVLIVNVLIAGLLIPPHHYLEKFITHKLVEKNKKIRLEAAHKTIASLEGKINTDNN